MLERGTGERVTTYYIPCTARRPGSVSTHVPGGPTGRIRGGGIPSIGREEDWDG